MKRKLLISLYFLSILTLPVKSQHLPTQKEIPKWVDKVHYDYNGTELNKDSVEDGYYYPVQDYQVNVAKKTNFYHYVRKILNENGVQNAAEIKVDFSPSHEKIIFHEIYIIRNNNKINKLDLKKIKLLNKESEQKNYIYNGLLSALLILDDVRPNDIIEYSYSIEGQNPVYQGFFFDSFYLQYYDPTSIIYRSIITPKERPLFITSHLTEIKPFVTTDNLNTKYIWELKNVSSRHPDDNIPNWFIPYPSVWVSEYKSWHQVVDWAIKMYSVDSYKSNTELSKKIDLLNNTYLTKEEKLTAMVRFVQDSIRYTGIEDGIWGVKPFSPSQVFSLRYGDCKGKSLLLCFMLQKVGINAYPALVNSYYKQEINNRPPSPSCFDHCILNVELNGKQYWYDATQSLQKGNFDKIFISDYKTALIIKPGNKSLSSINLSDNNISRTKIKEDYYINDGNLIRGANLNVETEYEGYDADVNRGSFQNTTLKDIEKSYLNYYFKTYPSVKSMSLPKYEDNEVENIFKVTEEYIIDNIWVNTEIDNSSNLEASFYANALANKIQKVSNLNRSSPFEIESPLEFEYIIKIHTPEHWDIENENVEIKGPGFRYNKTIRYYNNVITIKHSFVTTRNYIEASEISEYNREVSKIFDEIGYTLTYNNNSNKWNFSSSLNVLFFVVVIGVIVYWFKR